jgi:hypothetical protein
MGNSASVVAERQRPLHARYIENPERGDHDQVRAFGSCRGADPFHGAGRGNRRLPGGPTPRHPAMGPVRTAQPAPRRVLPHRPASATPAAAGVTAVWRCADRHWVWVWAIRRGGRCRIQCGSHAHRPITRVCWAQERPSHRGAVPGGLRGTRWRIRTRSWSGRVTRRSRGAMSRRCRTGSSPRRSAGISRPKSCRW